METSTFIQSIVPDNNEEVNTPRSVEGLVALVHLVKRLSLSPSNTNESKELNELMNEMDRWLFPRLISQLISLDFAHHNHNEEEKELRRTLQWSLYFLIHSLPFPFHSLDAQITRALMLEAIECSGVSGLALALPPSVLSELDPSIGACEGNHIHQLEIFLLKVEMLGTVLPCHILSRKERSQKFEGRMLELLVKYKDRMLLKNLRTLPLDLE